MNTPYRALHAYPLHEYIYINRYMYKHPLTEPYWTTYLGEHGLPVVSYHGSLVAVQGYRCIVEWLFRMFKNIVQVCDTSFKDTAEVSRYKCPANCWNVNQTLLIKLDTSVYFRTCKCRRLDLHYTSSKVYKSWKLKLKLKQKTKPIPFLKIILNADKIHGTYGAKAIWHI